MSWKVEKGWHNTIFKPDSRPHPVKVLTAEEVTAEQCPVRGRTMPFFDMVDDAEPKSRQIRC
jgi:hypothetical protein